MRGRLAAGVDRVAHCALDRRGGALVVGGELAAPRGLAEHLAEQPQVALVLLRRLEVDVDDRDPQPLDAVSEPLAHERLEDHEVGREGGDLLGTHVALEHRLLVVVRVDRGEEVALALIDAAYAHDALGDAGEEVERVGDHEDRASGGDDALRLERHLHGAVERVGDGPRGRNLDGAGRERGRGRREEQDGGDEEERRRDDRGAPAVAGTCHGGIVGRRGSGVKRGARRRRARYSSSSVFQ